MKKVTAILFSMAVGLNAVSMAAKAKATEEQETDMLLIGGGIMSATLGTYLQELEPGWSMTMVERLDGVAQESSNGWNNAGTGHSALMELNYTPKKADGSVSIEKAVEINEAFQISRQFWAPLVMEGRDPNQKVAATRTEIGTDVNYGEITRQLVASLQKKPNFALELNSEVRGFKRNNDNTWTVTVADLKNGEAEHQIKAKFVFIGAGGAALKLLQETGISEAKGYAGFLE
ncbi:malate:quinone oxidoreductase, partial [Citrobacter rodentium]|uniref:malate:quinone oxidoreductase n=1 Tax=Citrobacter rodentium TaxID=67825 RepID=UPI0005AF3FE5